MHAARARAAAASAGRVEGGAPAANAAGIEGGARRLGTPRTAALAADLTKAVLRYTATAHHARCVPDARHGAHPLCWRAPATRCASPRCDSCPSCHDPASLAVLPAKALAHRWLGALAAAGGALLECATCDTMVQRGRRARAAAGRWSRRRRPSRRCSQAALQAWAGAPPCRSAVVSGRWQPQVHEELVALGVHAWSRAGRHRRARACAALLARAHARWRREQALRDELAQLRSRTSTSANGSTAPRAC